jgi:DNA helicase-2/ATP-dependent DNA helicase PcrA
MDASQAESVRLELPELVEQVNERSQLLAHYTAERDGEERIDNLRELVNAAVAFFGGSTRRGRGDSVAFAGRISHVHLSSPGGQAGEGTDAALQLMTVHSAKGLEFNAVFVTGLEEGLFPARKLSQCKPY